MIASQFPLSYLAGVLSTLSPCVLPLLPVILAGAIQQHGLAPLTLSGGVATAYTAVGLFVASVGFGLGIDTATVRFVAAILMMVFGVILLVPGFQSAFATLAGRMTGGAGSWLQRVPGQGLGGQFLLGLLLGAVWSPCAGPTLGAAVGMAATTETAPQATALMALFSVGAVTPLLLLAYGSRQTLLARRERLAHLARWGKPALGGVLLFFGSIIVTGIDKSIESGLTAAMPAWLLDVTTRF